MTSTAFDLRTVSDILYIDAPDEYIISRAIGVPVSDTSIPTACVSLDESTKKITFRFNPEFAKTLTERDTAFVVAHESRHVFLNHLADLTSGEYENRKALTLAQECVINDYLDEYTLLDAPEDCIQGIKEFGISFADFTTREAYDYIVENMEEDDIANLAEKAEESCSESEAEPVGDDCSQEDIEDAMTQVFVGVLEEAQGSDTDISSELIDTAADGADENSGSFTATERKSLGTKAQGVLEGLSMNWKEYLLRVNPDIKTAGDASKSEETWARPQRKLMDSYPNVILPGMHDDDSDKTGEDGNLPTVIVALDLSYSIPRRFINDMIYLMDTVPNDYIDVRAITWSSDVREYDKKERKVVKQDATEIHLVWEYAQQVAEEIGEQPYVLVITDGGFFLNDNIMDFDVVFNRWNFALMEPWRDEIEIKERNYSRLNNGTKYFAFGRITPDKEEAFNATLMSVKDLTSRH